MNKLTLSDNIISDVFGQTCKASGRSLNYSMEFIDKQFVFNLRFRPVVERGGSVGKEK